jgi:nitrogen PTS system EIIA component
MTIADLVAPEAVLHGLSVANKHALIVRLAAHAATLTGIDAGVIAAAIDTREAEGSTGFGGGTAIPHVRLADLAAPMVVLAQLARPVDYRALDGAAVDLVALVLAPIGQGAAHLKALAATSRLLRDAALVAKLRGATSADAMHRLVTAVSHARAA